MLAHTFLQRQYPACPPCNRAQLPARAPATPPPRLLHDLLCRAVPRCAEPTALCLLCTPQAAQSEEAGAADLTGLIQNLQTEGGGEGVAPKFAKGDKVVAIEGERGWAQRAQQAQRGRGAWHRCLAL